MVDPPLLYRHPPESVKKLDSFGGMSIQTEASDQNGASPADASKGIGQAAWITGMSTAWASLSMSCRSISFGTIPVRGSATAEGPEGKYALFYAPVTFL